ncbi:hypothetical protein [Rhodococcoides fascians]|uniref:hypothetical protein n=1 Tax=Rhodococcoides fascians TaxID=1828 RepID=UPI00050C8B92|nr:hypothetical protein [Rhodococcus fascians]
MATKHGVNYKYTAGHKLMPLDKAFRDATALASALHPDQTIGDATKLAARLGYDLVLTHVERTPPQQPKAYARPWGLPAEQPIVLHTNEQR